MDTNCPANIIALSGCTQGSGKPGKRAIVGIDQNPPRPDPVHTNSLTYLGHLWMKYTDHKGDKCMCNNTFHISSAGVSNSNFY